MKKVICIAAFMIFSGQGSGLLASDPPFGVFATPMDGATVSSSVAVTGWALDDVAVTSLKIYRDAMVFIGDAAFVEGARPDIAEDYPTLPNNTSAGWGFMLQTYLLPGDGTYTLHAVATDGDGNSVVLGSKTIIVENANAVNPFGEIDKPEQGGTASGTAYRIYGWTLTPQPNAIPIDGSTIDILVDGVNLGHPSYNIYREDIAKLFPDYANSDGAMFYFDLNTTLYADGTHTVYAQVTDDAGNTDGIGSRFFNIDNDTGLPVELHCFSAEAVAQGVRLSWTTESEMDNLGFILERREVNVAQAEWRVAASYATHPSLCGCGNSSERHDYEWIDSGVKAGCSYRYRLSEVNTSGGKHLYDTIEITLPGAPEEVLLKQPYPNPFNPQTRITYQLAEAGPVEITVYNLLGRKVKTLLDSRQAAGSYHVWWHGKSESGSLSSTGTYFIVLKTKQGVRVQKAVMMR